MERRKFLSAGLAIASGAVIPKEVLSESSSKMSKSLARFGIVSDVHYAKKTPQINRYYEQSLNKLKECVDTMNREKVDFLIELGDFKDQGESPSETQTLDFLDTIESQFQKFEGPCYHVLGNHDEDSISKSQFLSRIRNGNEETAKNFYSFLVKGIQFLVIDANFISDDVPYEKGNFDWKICHVSSPQLEWLKTEIENYEGPSVIFIHQRLDSLVSLKNFCPGNADEVRKILEDSGKVIAVFQGHDHRGGFNSINGIPYYSISGMIEGEGPENNSYAIVEIIRKKKDTFQIEVRGYRKASSLTFKRDYGSIKKPDINDSVRTIDSAESDYS